MIVPCEPGIDPGAALDVVHRHVDDAALEVWAGIECTMNRVGDRYFDQLARAGHYERGDDIDRLADLGVRVLRYPVLWERHASNSADVWHVTTHALERMRARGVTPIIGLVHHGSGPPGLHLADPAFATGLAVFAATVARRFPWVRQYTPINEPLTTARFGMLYGHWYPHVQSDYAFVLAMLNQSRATALAMRAIRAIRPDAELVQTEDLSYTHATPALQYQADFENERRWLTFDLLAGRVVRGHALWSYVRRGRKSGALVDALAAEPCPADLIGLNHYLTSERLLDERLERFPDAAHGGNGRDRYADVEAIRALGAAVRGPAQLLREAWERHQRPLAVTEVHLGCSRDQQLRWISELWDTGRRLREEGVPLRAITAWAAFGSYNWPSLLTRDDGTYESGLFDVRAPEPRPTALAEFVRATARGDVYDHPVLDTPGWWHSDQRLIFDVSRLDGAPIDTPPERQRENAGRTVVQPARNGHVPGRVTPRRILIAGGSGTLGRAFAAACEQRQLACLTLTRSELDVTDARRVAEVLDEARPWAVINAAGFVRVDDAEQEREACRWTNTIGPAVLADRCVTRDIALLTFSTDLVFDGRKDAPYVESDAVAPLNTYGRSKAEAERLLRELMPSALVVRTSAFFGDADDQNFLTRTLAALATGRRVRASDLVISPTYVPDLVDAALDLLIDGEQGIWHLANAGAVTWAEFAEMGARASGLSTDSLRRIASTTRDAVPAPRPRYSALGSERGTLMPPLERAVERFAAARSWERLVRSSAAPRSDDAFLVGDVGRGDGGGGGDRGGRVELHT